jgi:DNA-binding transcriptional regulator YhcF (GntR family)
VFLRVDLTRNTPLANQIAAGVRRSIANGSVQPGERLPGARELAESLQVSIHTVLAGYQMLRDEGLIELRRGRGAIVRQGSQASHAAVIELAQQLARAARRVDLAEEELLGLVRTALRGA